MSSPSARSVSACASAVAISAGVAGKTAGISSGCDVHRAAGEVGLQSFVDDAFMGRMHVDDDQSVVVLRRG
jgi:hypothetical protein